MTYAIWDRQTPVYNLSPEQIISGNPEYAEETYIFYNDDGSIYDLIPLSRICNPDGFTDADMICSTFIERIEQMKSTTASERIERNAEN